MKKLLWLLLIASFSNSILKAQNKMPAVYQVKADTAKGTFEVPDSNWQILEDPAAKLTIMQVSSPAFGAKFHTNTTRTKGYDYHITNYWLRYTFKNTLTHPVKLYLKETVAYAYLYTLKPDSTWNVQTTGALVPYDKRDGLKRFTGFIVTIDAGQEITFYEKDIFDFWLNKPELFSMRIAFADAYIKKYYIDNDKELRTTVIDAVVFGFVLMAVLINLLFYRVVKEKTYLYFSLFLLCMGSYMFLNSNEAYYIIAKHHQYVYNITRSLLIAGFFFFLMQFIRNYLSTPLYTRKWDKFLIILSWILVVLLLINNVLPTTLNYKIYDIINLSSLIILYAYFPILLFTMLYYLRKNTLARTGIVAILPTMFWMGIVYSYMFIYDTLFQEHKITTYPKLYTCLVDLDAVAILVCFSWLVIVFSWILFKRYQDLQKSLVQASLDREIERNQLIEKQNEELEKKVALRTAELSEQQEEITAQRDQLSETVNELKTTQQQLIQSEKLASLGELTAGIAHEIQNPLNFVNNFSEVSMELAVEIKDELKLGNIDEVIDIVDNIEQNLEKIIHHGKRADAIVKNMLQHSRNNSAEKQLTDINALADEYLRLSYHGLRAKDKLFNSDMKTDFDASVPKVEMIGQDIGRVLLNLFNNAFYAVQQRKKAEGDSYKPEVKVSTRSNGKFVEVKVTDNGTGIPDNVKGKILQPFFTTKPTGEGTGLGLSLSYDIVVKGHGGTMDINSKEGEYTEFIINIPV